MAMRYNPLTGELDLVTPRPEQNTFDFHSGFIHIETGITITIYLHKQSINYFGLTIDGTLVVDGMMIYN